MEKVRALHKLAAHLEHVTTSLGLSVPTWKTEEKHYLLHKVAGGFGEIRYVEYLPY